MATKLINFKDKKLIEYGYALYLHPVHSLSGSILVEEGKIEYDSSGNAFEYYMLDASGNYVEDVSYSLDSAKVSKTQEIKTERDIVVNGTMEYTDASGNILIVDANPANRSTMHQAYDNAMNAGVPESDTVNWKMGDNTYQVISYETMRLMGLELGVFINDAFQHEAMKLYEIDQCTDVECVNGIEW